MADPRARVRELAAEYIRRGDPLGWFEALYQEAEAGHSAIPWADMEPNRRLMEFWGRHPQATAGRRALVIGCGLGDDSEQLALWGFQTTAFDISKTAIEKTKGRYPQTQVDYVVADLFHPPNEWVHAFDFVLEIYTVQSFPAQARPQAIRAIAEFVAPGGRLLVIARGRWQDEAEALGPPWPVSPEELQEFQQAGLEAESVEDYTEPDPPWVRRFRILYRRPKAVTSSCLCK